MSEARAAAARLEAVFARIRAERMDGVPILNERLGVEAVGAREWNGCWLTALVTPWFINLMLLARTPEQAAAWSSLDLGSSAPHLFPAGQFDFLVGEEGDLGRYQMCSLFSPVLEFEDHETARAAAAAALDALFDASLDPKAATEEEKRPAAPEAPARPSRRGFLSGKIAPGEGVA